ncbi:polysaccharide biosynthesis protein [Gorillibacterium timonense]|uniref:polysaccharide biosynthesis protein n=1 Tax=Gorillibacterium timonense TaxID=1689269 RepID=UPI00071C291A|nr:nucleoside-diphosphate sugar epimerase/dehydratase [Gorillibacterium timonense]
MTYRQRLSFLFFTDSFVVITAIFFSRYLTSPGQAVNEASLVISSLTLLLSHHFFSIRYKLYKKAWEYASIGELVAILKAVSLSIVTAAAMQLVVVGSIYFRVLAVTWMLHILLIGGTRFCWRLFRSTSMKRPSNKKRTLIVGAGSGGTMIVRHLLSSHETDLVPVAFVDDNVNKRNLDIMGVPVVGGLEVIEEVTREMKISTIIIAIPSLRRRELQRIYEECAKTAAKTQILPMIEDIVSGKLSVNQVRDVQVEDLLGREPVEMDMEKVSEYVTGKIVLVTGAGGSIGSEICRQVAGFHPEMLVLLGHGENSIYSIEMELREQFKDSGMKIIPEIADLQDAAKMMSVMKTYRPDVVYHAAAHKHVPLMERNPEEAVKNNIIGTMNAANAASASGVRTFVMISTDKAVNPTSVMGAAKRLAEMIIQDLDQRSFTKFVAVRFGNVLGSRGSVIPLFKKQIEKGGPVTVTHPDMIRYFMTIPEASRLVIQAGALARGGEIFVLDMGDPVRITDLAVNLIRLSGNSVEDIGIEYSGIRPGEKLFEELLNKDEVHEEQVYPKIYIGKTSELRMKEIQDLLKAYTTMEKTELRECLLGLANRRVPDSGESELAVVSR